MPHWTFGLAWVGFAIAIALHVADEATHDFLSVYNPNARAIRQRFRIPIPVFSFHGFIIALSSAVTLLLVLSPFAFQGAQWLRVLAIPVAILVGIGNGLLHLGGSVLYRRWMPGVLTAPLLLVVGSWLLWSTCQ
jgi:Protein of unknown function with HXXEE motif